MLVSPLMGPVMAICFGTIISDWELVVSCSNICCAVENLFHAFLQQHNSFNEMNEWSEIIFPFIIHRKSVSSRLLSECSFLVFSVLYLGWFWERRRCLGGSETFRPRRWRQGMKPMVLFALFLLWPLKGRTAYGEKIWNNQISALSKNIYIQLFCESINRNKDKWCFVYVLRGNARSLWMGNYLSGFKASKTQHNS